MLTTFLREELPSKDVRTEDFQGMLMIAAVLAVFAMMSVYYYGMRALAVTAVCVLTSWALDVLCLIIRGKSLHIHDISPIMTGLMIAVMLPATVPYTVAAAACAFAVCIAKHPFGGHKYEIVSSAAAGYIFAELSFPQAVLLYPKPFAELPLSNIVNIPLYSSFSKSAMVATSTNYSDFELLIGNFTGPMGCTFTVLTAVCAAVLISRKSISAAVIIGELCTVILWSGLTGGADEIKTVLAGGMLVFTAAFISADYRFAPKNTAARIFFGVLTGIMIIAVSEISALENPAVYACIIMAPFSRLMDNFGRARSRKKRVRNIFGASGDISETISMLGEEGNGEQT